VGSGFLARSSLMLVGAAEGVMSEVIPGLPLDKATLHGVRGHVQKVCFYSKCVFKIGKDFLSWGGNNPNGRLFRTQHWNPQDEI
jgi:hypothetical protein